MSERSEESALVSPGPFPRDTLVVEAAFPEAIGSDERGAKRVRRYLHEVAEIIRARTLRTALAHLSPTYGFSGWLPLEDDQAIHLYAWDEEGKETLPFVSVDISTPETLVDLQEVVEHLQGFVRAETDNVVYKTLRNPEGVNERTWRELAPHILRQRLAVAGKREDTFQVSEIRKYLRKLCTVLQMAQLSRPLVTKKSAYVHWETSGTIVSWEDDEFTADIYTCKLFDPAEAVRYTREALRLLEIISREF